MKKNYMFIRRRDHVFKVAHSLHTEGFQTSLSFLPLLHRTAEAYQREVDEYRALIDGIVAQAMPSDVTVKVHQFGFFESPKIAQNHIEQVMAYAQSRQIRVWLDMERPSTIDKTLEIFETLSARYENIGICLQAYLKRTDKDLERMLALKRPIRLVKGFYRQTDYPVWQDVQSHYKDLMHPLIEKGGYPCLGTHDPVLIEAALKLLKSRKGPYELQRFIGVREHEAYALLKSNQPLRIYVPYGNIARFIWDGWDSFDNVRHLQRLLRRPIIT